MNERIFKVDNTSLDDDMKAINEFNKALKEYIPQLYAQLRPIIGHDGPFTREEYDDAVTQLVWGGEE